MIADTAVAIQAAAIQQSNPVLAALAAELANERARADRAEQQLELERRTNAGLRGLAQMLIERLDRSTPVRHDGPGDVW